MLVHGALAINEAIDLTKQTIKVGLIFKVDFEKAYDLVSWSFLNGILNRFGSNDKWRT